MPFTFSHPAIVLPLATAPKRWISMTGLVAGSVSPDFEYFLRLNIYSYYGHSLLGIFWFDLPLGLVLAFLFHQVVRNTFFNNLPLFLAKRAALFKTFNWPEHFKRYRPAVVFSIIIGAASHIFWDAFTHKDGFFVVRIAALRHEFIVAHHSIPAFQFAQHLSSVMGALIILFVLLRLPVDPTYERRDSIVPFWVIISSCVIAFVIVRVLAGVHEFLFSVIIVTGIAGGLAGLIIIPLFRRRQLSTRP